MLPRFLASDEGWTHQSRYDMGRDEIGCNAIADRPLGQSPPAKSNGRGSPRLDGCHGRRRSRRDRRDGRWGDRDRRRALRLQTSAGRLHERSARSKNGRPYRTWPHAALDQIDLRVAVGARHRILEPAHIAGLVKCGDLAASVFGARLAARVEAGGSEALVVAIGTVNAARVAACAVATACQAHAIPACRDASRREERALGSIARGGPCDHDGVVDFRKKRITLQGEVTFRGYGRSSR